MFKTVQIFKTAKYPKEPNIQKSRIFKTAKYSKEPNIQKSQIFRTAKHSKEPNIQKSQISRRAKYSEEPNIQNSQIFKRTKYSELPNIQSIKTRTNAKKMSHIQNLPSRKPMLSCKEKLKKNLYISIQFMISIIYDCWFLIVDFWFLISEREGALASQSSGQSC